MNVNNKILETIGFGADATLSLIANGFPIPASLLTKWLYRATKRNKQDYSQIQHRYPALYRQLTQSNPEFLYVLAHKLNADFTNSSVGNREKIGQDRKHSLQIFNHLQESSGKKIYLPMANKLFENDASFYESIGYSNIALQSYAVHKKYENIADSLRDKPITVNVTCICAGVVSVLLSLKSRFNINIDVKFHFINAKRQMEYLIGSRQKEFDFLISANSPFIFHSENLLQVKKLKLLREIHSESIFIMKRKKLKNILRSHKFVSVYTNSTAEEYHHLTKNKTRYKMSEVDDIDDFLAIDEGLIYAWEPLATHLALNGWKRIADSQLEVTFSIFGNQHNRNAKYFEQFLDLLFYEWLICKNDTTRALEILLGKRDFIEKFRKGSGIN